MVNKAGKDGKSDGRVNLGRRRKEALFPAVPPLLDLPEDYAEALNEIKIRIQQGTPASCTGCQLGNDCTLLGYRADDLEKAISSWVGCENHRPTGK